MSLVRRYSIEHRHSTFVKGYEFLSFAKIIDKSISKNLSGKYSKKFLNHAKQSASFKKAIQKTGEASGDMFYNKIADIVNTSTATVLQRLIHKQMKNQ